MGEAEDVLHIINSLEADLLSLTDSSTGCPDSSGSEQRSIGKSNFSSVDGNNQEPNLKKNHKIISIKHLFSVAPKFTKFCKRGIFLSCIIYSEDKVLLTNEDFLPVLEVDQTFPTTLQNDINWLHKISSNWENASSFKADMEKCNTTSFHLRLKLLQTVVAMQNALSTTDLGRLYYKTTNDEDNTTVIITTVNYLRSTKMISCTNLRWTSIEKLNKRKSANSGNNICDALFSTIQEQILYHQVSSIPLRRGLYIGYLILTSSMDSLKIAVPAKTPNMIPHVKLRDNPKVSGEEWKLIHGLTQTPPESMDTDSEAKSVFGKQHGHLREEFNSDAYSIPSPHSVVAEIQYPRDHSALKLHDLDSSKDLFKSEVLAGIRNLFSLLGFPEERFKEQRFYQKEILQVSNSVSMLLVIPPIDKVCIPPGQSEPLLEREDYFILLPLQIFEAIHLNTYKHDVITRFAKVSATLEIQTVISQQEYREAFSSAEVERAKTRLAGLQELQQRLDTVWKSCRWIVNAISNARDKRFTFASVNSLQDTTTNCTGHVEPTTSTRRSSSGLKIRTHEAAAIVIQVYAAYDCGLSEGTSVRMQITKQTTALHVVELLIKQLSANAKKKGLQNSRTLNDVQPHDFCLVAVIGARERCLRNDFRPFLLQNPWRNGRLYVRRRNDITAAIELYSRTFE